MSEKNQIKGLIDEWKPRAKLADEIGANVAAVHKWAASNRIPSEWQQAVITAAKKAGRLDVDGDWMVKAHSRQDTAA